MSIIRQLNERNIPADMGDLRLGRAKKYRCPECDSDRSDKHDRSLSVKFEVNAAWWRCHYCGWTGRVEDTDASPRPASKPKKEYKRPDQVYPMDNKSIAKHLIEVRKLPESQVLDNNRIGSARWRFAGNTKPCIAFNYYKRGQHVNTKFKSANKEFGLLPGAETCLYNGDAVMSSANLEKDNYLIICEGEEDAESWIAAGYLFTVSVPNGGTLKGRVNTDYLDDYVEELEKIENVYLATDDDKVGRRLREELARRIGREKCRIIEFGDHLADPETGQVVKDANGVLQVLGLDAGKEYLRKLYTNAKEPPIDGLERVQDNMEKVFQYLTKGWPDGDRIGNDEFDRHLRWWEHDLTIFTGIPGSGKSNLVDWLSLELAKIYGYRVGVFSSEKTPSIHATTLCEKYLEKSIEDGIEEVEAMNAMSFVNDHFYYMKDTGGSAQTEGQDKKSFTAASLDRLLELGAILVKRFGIKLLVIDNWSYVQGKDDNMSVTDYVSHQLNKVRGFVEKFQCPVWIVAHPKKVQKSQDGTTTVDGYDISGSAHFFNKTDNGVSISRIDADGVVKVSIWKVRHDFLGKTGEFRLRFCRDEGRVYKSLNLGAMPMPERDPGLDNSYMAKMARARKYADLDDDDF